MGKNCALWKPGWIRTAYASFGGLLMALTGHYRHLSSITVGDNIYLLARK